MKKTVCDVCGKDIVSVKYLAGALNFEIETSNRCWDLCNECREELATWIKNKREKSKSLLENQISISNIGVVEKSKNNQWTLLSEWCPDFHKRVVVYMVNKKRNKVKYVLTEYLDHCVWKGIGTLTYLSRWKVVAWMYVPDYEEDE